MRVERLGFTASPRAVEEVCVRAGVCGEGRGGEGGR